jgi:hypothetical protein
LKKQIPLSHYAWCGGFFQNWNGCQAGLAVEYFEKIFFSPLRIKLPKRKWSARQQATLEEIVANGLKIQTYVLGRCCQALCFSDAWLGWPGNPISKVYSGISLAAGYQVVGFDGPAHGKSSGKRTTILEFETALKMVIGQMGRTCRGHCALVWRWCVTLFYYEWPYR